MYIYKYRQQPILNNLQKGKLDEIANGKLLIMKSITVIEKQDPASF